MQYESLIKIKEEVAFSTVTRALMAYQCIHQWIIQYLAKKVEYETMKNDVWFNKPEFSLHICIQNKICRKL